MLCYHLVYSKVILISYLFRLALPLVTREVVSLLLQGSGHNKSEVEDLSTYGFLYGTFPSAPGVFVYATSYSLDVDLVMILIFTMHGIAT